jgi:FkbH-like protein
MIGSARPFEESRYSRIAQLTQRSNQFNLRTIRYTEEEIRKISADDTYVTLYFTLKDKYGDYGLVGVVIMKKIDERTFFIDTWLMSCRVLKRGMEEYIVNKLVEEADKLGFELIQSEYIPTAKNAMVKDIYQKMGFHEYEDGQYTLRVGDYQMKNVYIMESK